MARLRWYPKAKHVKDCHAIGAWLVMVHEAARAGQRSDRLRDDPSVSREGTSPRLGAHRRGLGTSLLGLGCLEAPLLAKVNLVGDDLATERPLGEESIL